MRCFNIFPFQWTEALQFFAEWNSNFLLTSFISDLGVSSLLCSRYPWCVAWRNEKNTRKRSIPLSEIECVWAGYRQNLLMADCRSEATLPEQSQGVIRKNKDSPSRAISKHLIFVLRILSVSLIACLAGGLLSEREKNLRKRARSAKSERIPCGRCKKTGGGEERVGRGMEGRKKRELGKEGKGHFSFRTFLSLPFLRLSCKLRRERPILLATSVLICALDK